MRRTGIHAAGRGYGFWVRSFRWRPGMTVFLLMGERTQIEITSQRPAAVDEMRDAGRERALVAGEIDRERGDFLGGAEPSHRLGGDEHLAPTGTPGRRPGSPRPRPPGGGGAANASD